MEVYANLNGKSGISEYEIGDDYISVIFKSGKERYYKYNYEKTGKEHVERMKKLAKQGSGLNSYISIYVKKSYAEKR